MSKQPKFLIAIRCDSKAEAIERAKTILKENYPTFPWALAVYEVSEELNEVWAANMSAKGLIEWTEHYRRDGHWHVKVSRLRREWEIGEDAE